MPGLNLVGNVSGNGIADWLENGSYAWISNLSAGVVELQPALHDDSLSLAFASEVSRFSCAAYETILDASPPLASQRSLAWPLVKRYYAAFYSCHALLRVTGCSFTYVSGKLVNKLNAAASMYFGVSPMLTAGQYQVAFDASSSMVRLHLASSGGGSHEEMWKKTIDFLIEMENVVAASQGSLPDAIRAIQTSQSLRDTLCKAGKKNGAWLSSIRNLINYRQDFGVWFPYSISKIHSDAIIAKIDGWTARDHVAGSFDGTGGELERFVMACNVLAGMLLCVLDDLSNRSPTPSKSFVDRRPLKLLRFAKVK